MDLKTINEQPDGFCPPELTVKIVKVWDRKSGKNENGDWSFQNVDVEQNGTKATLKLKNLPEFPSSRVGQTLTIRANKSDTHGLTGIKTESRTHQGKTYKSITITQSGKWEWGSAAASNNGAQQNGHAPAQNGGLSQEEYTDHLLACAEVAEVIGGHLSLHDPQALQACFATVCIDAKNRGLLLKPKTLSAAQNESHEDGPSSEGDPFGQPDDDIPF